MISVLIATKDQERQLARSLSALVSAAVEGMVREVIVVDEGSRDGTAEVADAAGCQFLEAGGSLTAALRGAAARARSPWLLFLSSGMVLDPGWTREAADFINTAMLAGDAGASAAMFLGEAGARRRSPLMRPLAVRLHLAGFTRGESGLLLSASFYAALGGHPDLAEDVGRALGRRIGARRLTLLRPSSVRHAG